MAVINMTGTGTGKAVPVPTPVTLPFWEGAKRGELMVQRCDTTQRCFLYPRRFSPFTLSDKVSWVKASGRAKLYSYVISHIAAPGWADEVPYVIAVVELEEGVRMMSNLVNAAADPAQLPLDMPLQVEFRPRGEWMLPVFRPALKVAS